MERKYRVWIIGRNLARGYRPGMETNSSWLRTAARQMTTVSCDNVADGGVRKARIAGAKDGDLLVFANEFMVVSNRLASARPHVIRLAEGQDGSVVSDERQDEINKARLRAEEISK